MVFKRLQCLIFSALIFAVVSTPFQAFSGYSAIATSTKKNAFQDEQQWLVGSISTDISGILLYAAKKSGQADIDLSSMENRTTEYPNLTYQYDLRWNNSGNPESRKFTLAEYVWSPNNYAPWTLQLMQRLHLSKTAATRCTSAANILQTLANYDSAVIARENKVNSECLSECPLDPQAHENAALLCGVMALRECDYFFENLRPAINRISAHLSVARALRAKEEFSESGQVAELILLTLCGRKGDALARVKKNEHGDRISAPLRSWLNAISVRCTNDYRLADSDNGLLVEKFAFLRALATDRNVTAANAYLDQSIGAKNSPLAGIDWLRVAARGVNFVATGHQYAETSVKFEIEDYKTDYSLFNSANHARDIRSDLNLEPTGCLVNEGEWKLEAISWGDVASFHSRQLLDSICVKHNFETHLWGVPEAANETVETAERDFGQLHLFPLCKFALLIDALSEKKLAVVDNPQLTQAVADLITNEPQNTNNVNWRSIFLKAKPPHVIPDPADWLRPSFPFGTTFEPVARYHYVKDYSLEQLEYLRKLAPYDQQILALLILKKYGQKPTGDQVAHEFGALAEFNTDALYKITACYASEPDKYCQSLEKLAKIDPKAYFTLGAFYVKNQEPGKALIAYENGVRLSTDRVSVANSSEWLVFYYYDHGKKDKALALASEGAQIYSARGLLTMAKLQEFMGNLKDAENYYSSYATRYNDQNPLNEFYKTHQNDNVTYKHNANRLPHDAAPPGLRKANEGDYHQPPTHGVVLAGVGPQAQRFGLKLGDVLVGLDGYFINSLEQYLYVWNMPANSATIKPPSDNIDLVVWDGQAYRKFTATLPDRRLGCRLEDYKH